MNRSISKQSPLSRGNALLHGLVSQDKQLQEDFDDARVCNDISIDLYNLRVKAGLTQKELAQKLGVKQSNISRWERVGYRGYKILMLSKVARILGGRLTVRLERETMDYMASFSMFHAEAVHVDPITKGCMYLNPTITRIQIGHSAGHGNMQVMERYP